MNKLKFYRDKRLSCYEIKQGQYHLPAAKCHCHNELSIGIIENGTSMVSCQGIKFAVEYNHLVIFPPQVMHQCTPQNLKSWKFRMLYIDKNWFQSVFTNRKEATVSVAVKKLNTTNINQVKSFFSFLESEASPLEKETRLIMTLAALLSFTDSALVHNVEVNINADIRLLREYIEKHYLENITLDEMTAFMGMTKYYLIRLFNKNYAMTPHAYLMQLRLNYAKMMLKNGKDIAYVAQKSGFYDQSHFSNSFKQFCGVTPLWYQKLI